MKKFLTSLMITAAILLPAISLAANPLFTPRTIIKNSLERMILGKPLDHGASSTTKIDYVEKNLKNVVIGKGQAQIDFNYDVQYRESETQNIRFALSVPKLNFLVDGTEQEWNDPIGIEVLSLGTDSSYFRITKVNPQLETLIKGFGVDLSSIIGQWIKAPTEKELTSLGGLDEVDASYLTDDKTTERFKNWYLATVKKSGSPISITRSGRVSLNGAGEKIQIVRVTFNTRWFKDLENLKISEYKIVNPETTAREIATQRKQFKADVSEFKKVLSKIKTDLTLNLTTGVISDTNVNLSGREPQYTTDFKMVNGKYKTIKKLKGYSSLNLNTVVNFHPVSVLALEAPATSLDGNKVWDMIYTKPVETEQLDMPSTSTETDNFGLNPIGNNL